MADATPLRIGANNGNTDKQELFLKVYSGEVLSAFETANVTLDKQTIRTISSGKSATFPCTGKLTASYHTPGTEIVGQAALVSEKVITIDDLLISPVYIPSIDEAMNHYDFRAEYSKQTGIVLANTWDKNSLQSMVLAARGAAAITGGNGGTVLTSTTTLYRTSATDLAAGIYAAVQAMVEKDVPGMDDKNVFLRPAQYYLLAQNTALFNSLYASGNGNYADGSILRIGGAKLVMTNQLPITNIATGLAKYQGDFSKTAAVVATKAAIGTVKLMDLATEMEWDIRRQATLIVAKYAIGTGILRVEAAAELKTTT